MYPFYGVTDTLGEDDIKGIQSLYGESVSRLPLVVMA